MSKQKLKEELEKRRQFNRAMTFDYWFDSRFLMNLNYAAPIIVSENRNQNAKFHRIKQVAQIILDNPDKPIDQLRREIATKFFVTMRTALDYINYSRLIIEEFRKFKAQNA
jgi:hypothetical protein